MRITGKIFFESNGGAWQAALLNLVYTQTRLKRVDMILISKNLISIRVDKLNRT